MKTRFLKDVATLTGATALALVALFYLKDLNVTSDNRVFYHDANPRYVQLVEVEQQFELYSNVTFLILTETGLSKDVEEAVNWLSQEVESYQGYVRHHSLANYPHVSSSGSTVQIRPILEMACDKKTRCDDLRDVQKYPELQDVVNRLISADGRAFAMSVAVDIEIGDNIALDKLTTQIEQTLLKFENNYPNFKLAHTGAIPMMQAFADASSRDLGRLFPISIVFMFVLSTFLFASIRFAAVALTCSMLNVILIMGLASLLMLPINSATSTLPLALLVISISASAHLICYISLRSSTLNTTRDSFGDLVSQACKANRSPILMASLTTCIGLATLSFVEIPPFREFGLLAALGTITNYFIVVTVLPAALRTIPIKPSRPSSTTFYTAINKYARYIDDGKLPIKRVIALFLCATMGLANFTIDEDYIKYFDESHEFRIGADLLTKNLASPYSIDVTIDFIEHDLALSPRNLIALELFQENLTADELVVNSLSIVQHLKSAERAFGTSETDRWSNTEDEYLQQLYLAYELSLPTGHSTNELIDPAHQKLRVSLLLGEASSSSLVALERRVQEMWGSAKDSFSQGATISVSGETLPLAHLSTESLIEVLLSILTCIALLLVGVLIATKNIAFALISIGAIAAPLAFAFGSWAWVDSEFGLATALVIAVTIGILVDDTIHFLHRYRAGRLTYELNSDSAISYAIHHSAAGIVSSSLILVSGFVILCFSSFAVNQQFGIGVSLTIASALLLTLIGLPAALITFKPRLN